MQPDLNKSERRTVRELAGLSWERQLRDELLVIGVAIGEMQAEKTSPHDVNDLIHRFHNGASRELFNRYSGNTPWLAVCRAHFDGILNDNDIESASEKIRDGIRKFASTFRTINGFEPPVDGDIA